MTKPKPLSCGLIILSLLSPLPLSASDLVEEAGMGVGMTAGNAVLLPAKAASVTLGLAAGLLSFVFTAGDTEVTQQIWQNSTEDPYLITPEVAKKAIGERPEIELK